MRGAALRRVASWPRRCRRDATAAWLSPSPNNLSACFDTFHAAGAANRWRCEPVALRTGFPCNRPALRTGFPCNRPALRTGGAANRLSMRPAESANRTSMCARPRAFVRVFSNVICGQTHRTGHPNPVTSPTPLFKKLPIGGSKKMGVQSAGPSATV